MELTHASFFSGVGGLDLGLERAGWRTVSFSEIDPYASAVLAERWPGVPNLGDITDLAAVSDQGSIEQQRADGRVSNRHSIDHRIGRRVRAESRRDADWHDATLWSGGFPCQDLSVAGKRAGMGTHGDRADTRSGLAYAFLDLVEQHRPPAILLENVPGLLSSNRGRDFGALLDRLGQLGYWWAYRILDAQFFGVPQRRRRVFILALHAGAGFGADSAAAVLSVGSRCDGHSATGDAAGTGAAERPAFRLGSFGGYDERQPTLRANGGDNQGGSEALIFNATAKFGEFVEDDVAGNLSARDYKSSNHLIGAAPDPGGVRAADGLAGRLDDRPVAFTKSRRAQTDTDDETWVGGRVMPTLNSFDVGDTRTTAAIVERAVGGLYGEILDRNAPHPDDPLLPLGLDSHRYRCCGNGVVSNVSEWIGHRLAEAVA